MNKSFPISLQKIPGNFLFSLVPKQVQHCSTKFSALPHHVHISKQKNARKCDELVKKQGNSVFEGSGTIWETDSFPYWEKKFLLKQGGLLSSSSIDFDGLTFKWLMCIFWLYCAKQLHLSGVPVSGAF